MKINKHGEYLLSLLSYVIGEKDLVEKPTDISWEDFFAFCNFHKLANMVYYAVIDLEHKPGAELLQKWKTVADREIYRDAVQHAEMEQLIVAFNKYKKRFIAIKGFYMKELYPESHMRSMADIDLLILDSSTAECVKDFMTEMGFEVIKYSAGFHDIYYKNPVINVEVHKVSDHAAAPVSCFHNEMWESGFEESGIVEGNISAEDKYVYAILHLLKHYKRGGSGVRHILDMYLFLKKHGSKMDMQHVEKKLEEYNAVEFENDIRKLGNVWFGARNSENINADEYTNYIFESGLYGIKRHRIQNDIKEKGKGSKIKYIFQRLFPKTDVIKDSYPLLKKHFVFYPFIWLFRLFKMVLNRKDILNEIRYIEEYKPKY